MLKIGQPIPKFELPGYNKGGIKNFKSSDYHGKWLVLFSYPADFTFICPTEVKAFNEHYDKFQKLNADVVALSVDSPESHQKWVEQEWKELSYPLLSDTDFKFVTDWNIETKDDDGKTVALRATFIIDPDSILKYYVVSDNNVGRSIDETLRVLEALQTGKLCPVEWQHGEKTLN